MVKPNESVMLMIPTEECKGCRGLAKIFEKRPLRKGADLVGESVRSGIEGEASG